MNLARQVLEKSYTGTCSIYIIGQSENKSGIITNSDEPALFKESIPCALSYDNAPSTSQADYGTSTMIVTLFINPDLIVPTNARIEVTEYGRTRTFKNSGIPAVYDTHQEITLLAEEIA